MLARSGQLRSKVTEDQLKELLGAMAENEEKVGSGVGGGQISTTTTTSSIYEFGKRPGMAGVERIRGAGGRYKGFWGQVYRKGHSHSWPCVDTEIAMTRHA